MIDNEPSPASRDPDVPTPTVIVRGPNLTWEVERHDNIIKTLQEGPCFTVEEGIRLATRAILRIVGGPGACRCVGYVFCADCNSVVAASGGPWETDGWHRHTSRPHTCRTCADVSREIGEVGRTYADPPLSDRVARAAGDVVNSWCARLIFAGPIRRVELVGGVDIRILSVAGDVWRASFTGAMPSVEAEAIGDESVRWRWAREQVEDVVRRFAWELGSRYVVDDVGRALNASAMLSRIARPGVVTWWDSTGGPYRVA